MSEQTNPTLIQELRLRRWARANYVPADQRTDNHWHPVVLNEMEKRDVEMERAAEMDDAILTQFVPLEPTISQLYPDGDFQAVDRSTTCILKFEVRDSCVNEESR